MEGELLVASTRSSVASTSTPTVRLSPGASTTAFASPVTESVGSVSL
ncbi:hypothetical protein [Halosegnis marinus]